MNRRYTREQYLGEIATIRKLIPDCAITTDIIVGFPTETEEEFIDTLSLVNEVGFYGAFTFVYSPREGTKAAAMEGQIDAGTKKTESCGLSMRRTKETARILYRI